MGPAPAQGQAEQSSTLLRLGGRAWAIVGVAVVAAGTYLLLAGLSGLVVPLVVAIVVGTLFVPLVDWLALRMPRKGAAALVLLGLVVVGIGSVAIAVAGVVDQGPQIREELTAGLEKLREWVAGLGVDIGSGGSLTDGVGDAAAGAAAGISTFLSSAFSSVTGFVAGTAIGIFILFYLLADWRGFTTWVGSHLGVPADLGAGMVQDATWSIRRYFSALTVTSLFSAVAIGVAAAVMGLPLAFTIGLVTFVTSYVPYIGALVSGAFAVLIALGSGGVTQAAIVLAVILLVQNVLQPVLQNKMTAEELDLNPVVSFGSTIVGAAFAGVLGATLSAPVLSMMIRIRTRVRAYQAGATVMPGDATVADGPPVGASEVPEPAASGA